MIENQSILKKERMDFMPDRDMLSELPLSIIHVILAFVPFKDAVRTSILSRQWRYTWASLPQIVFEDECASSDPRIITQFEKHMKKSITHVLALRKAPIHKFKLAVPFKTNCRNIGVWLQCLSRNDIRELIIGKHYGSFQTQELHSSIYSCIKLTKLELQNCKLDPPPTTFKAFLFLKCLLLRKVFLSTDEVGSLVAKCPLLEEFTSIECGSSELRISAPNLKVLYLEGGYIEMSVYAPLLSELSVVLQNDGFNNSVCNYTDFIGGFTNLEKLGGNLYFQKYLCRFMESCRPTLVFHRLKDIELNCAAISVVARLIAGAPNLQKLKICKIFYTDEDEDDDASEVPHVSFSDFGCARNFKLEKLRVVEMRGFTTLPPQMAFIRFLLERSLVLETMSFGGLRSSKEKQLLSEELQGQLFIAELVGCSWASPNVNLTILR